MGVEASKHLTEDVNGVEVKRHSSREAAEEHEDGGEEDRFDELGHQDGSTSFPLLLHSGDVTLEGVQLLGHIHEVPLQVVKGLFGLLDLTGVDQVAWGLLQ